MNKEMVGQLTRVELNLHQMGLTSQVSAPENLGSARLVLLLPAEPAEESVLQLVVLPLRQVYTEQAGQPSTWTMACL